MRNKIKQIFISLKREKREEMRLFISKRYGKAVDTVKNNWLKKGDVPAQYQDEVLEILEQELKKQIEEDKKILSE